MRGKSHLLIAAAALDRFGRLSNTMKHGAFKGWLSLAPVRPLFQTAALALIHL
jgi:hypothetical protein